MICPVCIMYGSPGGIGIAVGNGAGGRELYSRRLGIEDISIIVRLTLNSNMGLL